MAEESRQEGQEAVLAERLSRLEARVLELESRVGVAASEVSPAKPEVADDRAVGVGPVWGQRPERTADEFEFEVGQSWFAKTGIVVLTIGAGFLLSLPFASLPAVVPSLAGYALSVGLLALAHAWRTQFGMVAGYLRSAGVALFYFSSLRLCFFGERHVLEAGSVGAAVVLVLTVAANFALAWRWKSPWLLGLVLAMGGATAIAVGSTWFALIALLALAGVAARLSLAGGWPALVLAGIPVCGATYLLWAINDPILGRAAKFLTEPSFAPAFLLAAAAILAVGSLLRRDRSREDGLTNVSALLNCALGYGLFFVHTLVAFPASFATEHLTAFLVFLGLAVIFWVREQSRVSTFFYAMTGYMALSMAIIKATGVPDVFVWLALQSIVVVATAIWFRSRFIVVANFLIYVAIVLSYVVVAERESGISIGFGIVALVSARIMNWQKRRLELKTELMRNAYLFSAFVIFPYALYFLVPSSYVGLAWVGLAVFYYIMNFVVRSQKFRWMGHGTLLFTTLYLAVVGTSRFEPIYRVLSFLVLGTVLLLVSLSFSRLRLRQRAKIGEAPKP